MISGTRLQRPCLCCHASLGPSLVLNIARAPCWSCPQDQHLGAHLHHAQQPALLVSRRRQAAGDGRQAAGKEGEPVEGRPLPTALAIVAHCS